MVMDIRIGQRREARTLGRLGRDDTIARYLDEDPFPMDYRARIVALLRVRAAKPSGSLTS